MTSTRTLAATRRVVFNALLGAEHVYNGYILHIAATDLDYAAAVVTPALGIPFLAMKAELTLLPYTDAEQTAEGVDWYIRNDLNGIWFGPADYTECLDMLDGDNNRIVRG